MTARFMTQPELQKKLVLEPRGQRKAFAKIKSSQMLSLSANFGS